ncbi:alpha/beta hydrolase fold [Burkholderia ambifaria IOP40-10]|jgi:pimeloyl-ACP methyl ester carboxylesterase|uniref:Alpha/beta hydrolase fold n=1 Tax=Burkholderia ambifaria IOP40-10 TaxID=396596 RepID=B1FHZ7_9BURK|nr:alpha/beta fold hydrolase [Burkholderia ambifaria]EDT02828.1 alpha/beta hydrolase fold [Burkholderia ambifaria IOP40-10]
MSEVNFRSAFVEFEGTRIHYQEAGEGPALIMLQGSGPGASGWSNYSRNAPFFARSHRVIVPDLAGWGKSDMRPIGVSIPGWWANSILGLMDSLSITQADIIGNSLGGMIALKMALTAPDRVGRLVLMGPAGGFPTLGQWPTPAIRTLATAYEGDGITAEKVKSFISESLFDQSAITDELVKGRLDAAMDPRIIAQPPMRLESGQPFEELWRDPGLATLPHETLIIWGREDRVVPLDTGMIYLKRIPNAQLNTFPKCGHWAQWEWADRFNRVVSSFLSEAR